MKIEFYPIKKGQEIVIYDEDNKIVITIRDIRGSNISIGIEAPDGMGVWRGELLDEHGQLKPKVQRDDC